MSVAALAAMLLSASLLAPVGVHAADEPPSASNTRIPIDAKQTQVQLTETESRILTTKARIKTVDGFDDKVLKVDNTDKPNEIRVLGLASGLTSLILVDENDQTFLVEVLVGGDVKHFEALIRRTFPDVTVQATKVKDAILLTGWVNQPDQLTTIIQIAEQFSFKVLNYLRVNGIQTVALRVKIMEVQRGRIRNLGFNFLDLQNGHFLTSSIGAIAPLASLGAPAIGAPPSPVLSGTGATAAFGVVTDSQVFHGFVEALKQEALLKILAEPTLVAISGRPSDFLSGGEFPILVPGGLGTVTVQFKPFGVKLQFVPHMEGNGRLRLDVATEVSEKDFSNTVTVGTTLVPGITTRRANAQVDMGFGETLVIAGLISNRIQARTQKVPFLGELPWVGAAFRRMSHDETETELLIIVTPDIASPMDEASVPPGPGATTVSPTDRELFGMGVLENKKYGPDPILDLYDPETNIQPTGYYGATGLEPQQPSGMVPGGEEVKQLPPLPPGTSEPADKSAASRTGLRRLPALAGGARRSTPATTASRTQTRPPQSRTQRPGMIAPRSTPARTASSQTNALPGLIGPTRSREEQPEN